MWDVWGSQGHTTVAHVYPAVCELDPVCYITFGFLVSVAFSVCANVISTKHIVIIIICIVYYAYHKDMDSSVVGAELVKTRDLKKTCQY